MIEVDLQWPPGRHPGVFVADGSCSRVPRIRKGGFAGVFERSVQLLKRLARDVDLAADLQEAGVGQEPSHAERDRLDGSKVLGDICSPAAIAAGGSPHELPVLIEERHAEAIDLRLCHVVERRAGKRARETSFKLEEVLLARGVVEREHGRFVLDRREQVDRDASDTLGGTVRGDELRIRFLQLPELSEEAIVPRVRDLRTVQDIILVIVLPDKLAKLFDTSGGVSFVRHNKVSEEYQIRWGFSSAA